MKILVVGGGGREHAIVWKLAQSSRVEKIYCAPGNGGTAQIAQNIPAKATDLEAVRDFALSESIDLVFVAPDDPLAMGMVDFLENSGIRAFGPRAAAARIEASKSYAKDLMKKYNIPTAAYEIFTDMEAALAYIERCELPVVIKADGLALGKGVIIAEAREEALKAVKEMMSDGVFGTAGRTIVVEEFLRGPELTVLAFADGKTVKAMVSSRDHKRALDGDMGLNTGGMGAIAPGADLTEEQQREMHELIFQPTIDAMRAEGSPFAGVIYFGLMLTAAGPKVIEYNARFGDPETQVVLPLLETDFVDIIDACIDGKLDQLEINWSDRCACVVVMASGGYPGKYETGKIISGLESAVKPGDDAIIFHAGTSSDGNVVITSGGRVLGVTALADSRDKAIDKAYEIVGRISFDNCHYRRDIGRTC